MTEISTTLGALVYTEAALKTLCGLQLSAKAAYHLKRLVSFVDVELAHFRKEQDVLIRRYGVEADGRIAVAPDSDGGRAFLPLMVELLSVPVVINWKPIDLSMLGDAKVAAADLLALGPLFTDDVA